MKPSKWDEQRYLIPRWRNFAQTVATGELSNIAPNVQVESRSNSQHFGDKIDSWNSKPNVITASELVRASITESREADAVDAAKFLLSRKTELKPMLVNSAYHILGDESKSDIKHSMKIKFQSLEEKRAAQQAAKKEVKARIQYYPKNPIAWVDLSLLELKDGNRIKAERSMQVALELASNNRFVIRSAARLFVHYNDFMKAHELVASCRATPSDPWLIATEISLASKIERDPKFYRIARQMATESELNFWEISELSSALGTFEFREENFQKAKKFLRQSIKFPTGSSLAQAYWLEYLRNVKLFGSKDNPTVNSKFELAEGSFFHNLENKEPFKAIESCKIWSLSEPYSIRPFENGSYVACATGEYEEAIKFNEAGLLLKRHSKYLKNNYAYSLTNKGDFERAEQILKEFRPADGHYWFVSRANLGLIDMRNDRIDSGIKNYKEAIEGFKKNNEQVSAKIAEVYLVRELALAQRREAKELYNKVYEYKNDPEFRIRQHLFEGIDGALKGTSTIAKVKPTK